MLKIDLGCGSRKHPDFVGIDRHPMPGVDIVADINNQLPLPDNSTSLIYASHSLEHIRDLMSIMREIFRIGIHGAQVCIVSPYNEQKLNLANPYHLNVFNEHTPRFWTDYPNAAIDEAEYFHPHAATWGLSKSDNSTPGLDLRLARMEFFYFPAYRGLSQEERRRLRQQRLDVCDQIMYHLIVWKPDAGIPSVSFEKILTDFSPFEPEYIKQRKMKEYTEAIRHSEQPPNDARGENTLADATFSLRLRYEHAMTELLDHRNRMRLLETELHLALEDAHKLKIESHDAHLQMHELYLKLENYAEKQRATDASLTGALIRLQERDQEMTEAENEIASLRAGQTEADAAMDPLTIIERALEIAKAEISSLQNHINVLLLENRELTQKCRSAETLRTYNQLLKAEADAANTLLDWHGRKEHVWHERETELLGKIGSLKIATDEANELRATAAIQAADNAALRERACLVIKCLSHENDAFKLRRKIWSTPTPSAATSWDNIAPAFGKIKQFSEKTFKRTHKAQIDLSPDLCNADYREYEIFGLSCNGMNISMAIIPLIPAQSGVVGIEIVSAQNELLAQVTTALRLVDPNQPTTFCLPEPSIPSHTKWQLRVFVKNADVPVAIYEIVEYRALRKAALRRPFIHID